MKKKKDLSKITFMGIAFPSIVTITFILYSILSGILPAKYILYFLAGLPLTAVFSLFLYGIPLLFLAFAPILASPVCVIFALVVIFYPSHPDFLQFDLVFSVLLLLTGISIIISAVKAKYHGRYMEDMSDFVTGSHYEATFQSNGNVRIEKVNDYADSNFLQNTFLYILRFYKILFLGVFIYIINKIKLKNAKK